MRQDEPGDSLYIVARGRMEVLVKAGEEKRRVNTLTDGDFFGEMALYGDHGRPRSVP